MVHGTCRSGAGVSLKGEVGYKLLHCISSTKQQLKKMYGKQTYTKLGRSSDLIS
jgi:hypothetical protein